MMLRRLYLSLVLIAAQPAFAASDGNVTGTITAINGATITLNTRGGVMVVDATQALQNHLSVPLVVEQSVMVHGGLESSGSGVFHATAILHAKRQPPPWVPDFY